ncbi:MAG: nucleotidyltransferase family protein [Granulosicoccus sp.]
MSAKPIVRRAVLLAAGRGKRLRPYTDNTPKPLLKHLGKPTLDYVMDSLQMAGVDEVVLVTHHLHEQVEEYAKCRAQSSEQLVSCVRQPALKGTANAMQCAIETYPDIMQQPYILSATDYLVPESFFGDLLKYHADHTAEITVSLKALPESELAERSSVRFGDDKTIEEIVEKPAPGTAPSSIGANLTFVLPSTIAPYIAAVPLSQRGETEIQYAINEWLANGGSARGLIQCAPNEWQPPQRS